jgi:hypothetical protein
MIDAGIDAYHQLDRDFDADARIVFDYLSRYGVGG